MDTQSAAQQTAKLYKSVIEDVVKKMAESFQDENIDLGVLKSLKEQWEEKLEKSDVFKDDRVVTPGAGPSMIHPMPMAMPVMQQSFVYTTSTRRASMTLPNPNLHRGQYLPQHHFPQLDGGGFHEEHMKDEMPSSDEEDEGDVGQQNDQILKADAEEKEEVEYDKDVVEEEPLNSDDDEKDAEDLYELFHSDNVVFCQFEKVSHARGKWKVQLKDGVMHAEGKDYVFNKCSGDVNW